MCGAELEASERTKKKRTNGERTRGVRVFFHSLCAIQLLSFIFACFYIYYERSASDYIRLRLLNREIEIEKETGEIER